MMKIEVGKSYDIAMKVWRKDVKVVAETEKSLKVCCNYRLQGREKWEPIYSYVSKDKIIEAKEIQNG